MKLVRYSGSGEWSALYVDGKLDTVGDHYNVDERISELCGVEVVDSDDFLRGGNYRDDVAPTLDAITEYEEARTAAERKAEELEAQAAAILAEAAELRNSK